MTKYANPLTCYMIRKA